MKRKNIFVFVLLMLPNIVFASMLASFISGVAPVMCTAVCTVGSIFAGFIGGYEIAKRTEKKDKEGNILSPERKRVSRENKYILGGMLIMGVVGLYGGLSLSDVLNRSS